MTLQARSASEGRYTIGPRSRFGLVWMRRDDRYTYRRCALGREILGADRLLPGPADRENHGHIVPDHKQGPVSPSPVDVEQEVAKLFIERAAIRGRGRR